MIIRGRSYSNMGLLFLLLLILNGIIFVSSLPALFDPSMALRIHSDLSPDAGYLMIFAKSIICLLTGLAYLIAAYGFHRCSSRIIFGTLGAIPFFVLYLVEISFWGLYYPHVWVGFLTFGVLSLIISISCLILGRRYKIQLM